MGHDQKVAIDKRIQSVNDVNLSNFVATLESKIIIVVCNSNFQNSPSKQKPTATNLNNSNQHIEFGFNNQTNKKKILKHNIYINKYKKKYNSNSL